MTNVTVPLPPPTRAAGGAGSAVGTGAVPPVLLAVAHGTSDPVGIDALDALMGRVRALAPAVLGSAVEVRLCYVDHEPPSVTRALAALADEGAAGVAVPLLLGAASHSKGDIAGSVRLARAARPGFSVAYGRPLGADPLLLGVLADRLAAAGAGAGTAVVLGSAGSADPDANAEVARVARLLWEHRSGGRPDGAAPVEPAYAGATSPSIGEVLERLRRLGYGDVAVAPYFLAPGRLPRAVAEVARGAGARVAEVLGAHDGVARVVLARYAEAIGGPVLMNCDTCQYRAPWPGRETRVGAPQRPHTHPAD